MNPLIVKLIVLASCAGCKLIGELWWHNAQRFIMPVILMVGIDIMLHSWWLGALCLPMIAPLCMGYSTYGKSDGFDRAVWLMLIVLAEGLGLAILHHLSWFIFVPWVILSAVWGGVTRSWWNVIISPLSGLLIGSIIFFVR
jgi:hypothetical protein